MVSDFGLLLSQQAAIDVKRTSLTRDAEAASPGTHAGAEPGATEFKTIREGTDTEVAAHETISGAERETADASCTTAGYAARPQVDL